MSVDRQLLEVLLAGWRVLRSTIGVFAALTLAMTPLALLGGLIYLVGGFR